MRQLDLFSTSGTEIETIHITPTKEMPFEVFAKCYQFSAWAEILERTPDGKVIWNEDATEIWAEGIERVMYEGLQNDWFQLTLEVPKEWFSDEA
jgi:hypothetical protein